MISKKIWYALFIRLYNIFIKWLCMIATEANTDFSLSLSLSLSSFSFSFIFLFFLSRSLIALPTSISIYTSCTLVYNDIGFARLHLRIPRRMRTKCGIRRTFELPRIIINWNDTCHYIPWNFPWYFRRNCIRPHEAINRVENSHERPR